MMNSATTAPLQPSIFTPVKRATSIEIRTTSVAKQSVRESIAVALMPGEFIFLPTARL